MKIIRKGRKKRQRRNYIRYGRRLRSSNRRGGRSDTSTDRRVAQEQKQRTAYRCGREHLGVGGGGEIRGVARPLWDPRSRPAPGEKEGRGGKRGKGSTRLPDHDQAVQKEGRGGKAACCNCKGEKKVTTRRERRTDGGIGRKKSLT